MKTKYLLGICALAAGSLAVTSCSDDDTYDVYGNPNNLVYVNIAGEYPDGMPKNSFAYTIYHTPAGPVVVAQPGDVQIDVMCTKNAVSDITVTLEVDPTMSVPGYATIPAEAGIKVTLQENTLTIPAGTNRSDGMVTANVDVTNANWSLLTEKAYLIPIKISSTSAGIPSQTVGAAYIGVLTDVKNGMTNPVFQSSPAGTKINPASDWTGTWVVPATGNSGTFGATAFDDNRSTYPYLVWNHADRVNEELINTFDFVNTVTAKGIKLQYYGIYYTIKDAKIETSLDGTEWTDQGSVSDEANNNNIRYISFWGPLAFRYMRITTHSFYGGTGEGTVFSDIVLYE